MPIQRIEGEDVHRITSGQVITDLTTAVKEVLENALDSGAKQVHVTFKNHGLDSIMVSDNGSGIKEDDFDALCLKHYTSKLASFEDVETVETLGFRGEAMSSLCAIAEVAIQTATKEGSPKGWSLKYNKMGLLGSKEVVSRSVGTTVEISRLFETLPVRRIDLEKNIKREFHKAIEFLQCYALMCTGVRLVVHHTDARNRKSILLSTAGAADLKRNVLAVFGSNGMHGLEAVNSTLEVPAKLHHEAMAIKLTGYVSNASFGQGRSANDRQFWFVNGRPVHMPKFSKAINETYKKFNHLQSPVIILNLEINPRFVDVNVTPDKRTVMLNNEPTILEALRESFYDTFSAHDVKIPRNQEATEKIEKRQATLEGFAMIPPSPSVPAVSSVPSTKYVKPEKPTSVRRSSRRKLDFIESDGFDENVDNEYEHVEEEPSSDEFVDPNEQRAEDDEEEDDDDDDDDEPQEEENEEDESMVDDTVAPKEDSPPSEPEEPSSKPVISSESGCHCCLTSDSVDDSMVSLTHPPTADVGSPLSSPRRTPSKSSRQLDALEYETHNLERTVDLTPDSFRIKRRKVSEENCSKQQPSVDNVANPNAEELLTLTVSKNDFLKMEVVGQFNLGFILVTRKNEETGRIDLFIVDQHASDEKYNFERFQRETTFQSQPLVVPESLELNTVDEMVVMNHKDIFAKNGFKLRVDQAEEPGRRVKLVALPYSKNTVFDQSDFNELINLIRESDGDPNVRPSKVRAMFAMRACRSSIMIGRPLNRQTMTTVVRHLSGLDKPWNCPHGRPTMRHLVELQGWAAELHE